MKKCCNKEMIYLGFMENPLTERDSEVWICGDCGTITEHKTYNLDEEELYNFVDYHTEKLNKTKIFKEYLKNFKNE